MIERTDTLLHHTPIAFTFSLKLGLVILRKQFSYNIKINLSDPIITQIENPLST